MADPAYGKLGWARFYALMFGVAYVTIGILEIFYRPSDPLVIGGATILAATTLHTVVHVAVAAALIAGFVAGEAAARTAVRIVGILLVALAVWGFVAPSSLGGVLGYGADVPTAYGYIHAATGVLALLAGFAPARTRQPATA